MTKIFLTRENGKIVSFEAKGHSGYAPEGEDIVCAAISSVMWATVNGLENVAKVPVSYTEQDGFLSCRILGLSDIDREKADILLESMADFLFNLAKTYSEYVAVTEV